MRKRVRLLAAGSIVVMAAAVAGACGGGTSAAKKYEGDAASATAQFFVQEANGGKLPEGTEVVSLGSQKIVTLDVSSDQKKASIKVRYCLEYEYREKDQPTKSHKRVYIAQLVKDEWSVESVKPDGDCSGVS
jgi:hypothetical protein